MPSLDELFQYLIQTGASDLHLGAGSPPHFRRYGQLSLLEGWPALSEGELISLLQEICEGEDWQEFEKHGELAFTYALTDGGRVRCRLRTQHGGLGASFRPIPASAPSIEELGLPEVFSSLCTVTKGLIVIASPAGGGRTTTAAAMVHKINTNYSRVILSIEKPVEFLHQRARSIVIHREPGRDCQTPAQALHDGLRMNPDVIQVGDAGSADTVRAALMAAEMGALVIMTVAAPSVVRAVEFLVGLFPDDRREQIRHILGSVTEAICAQLLVTTSDQQQRCMANEILLRCATTEDHLRQGKTQRLEQVMAKHRSYGMQLMKDSINQLTGGGRISQEDDPRGTQAIRIIRDRLTN